MDSTQTSDKSGANGDANGAARTGDARENLMNDMKNVINEAEHWLGGARSRGGENMRTVKEKFESTLNTAKTDLAKLQANVTERGKLAAHSADTYVKDNPWTSVGLGAAVGVLLGLLIGRK
jgi:ElaB/YqjD/DUF883 family membrane-anchored ribosome-binding protein